MFVWLLAPVVSLLSLACFFAALLGLPGTWAMVVISLLLTLFAPDTSMVWVPWSMTVILALIAGGGEFLEFVASAAGVGKLGGAQRSALLALAGSILGAIVGLFVGLPVPVVGPVVSSILLGGVGAALGAVAGERWVGKGWKQSARVGAGAMLGRLLGTIGKSICAGIMLVLLVWQVWI